MQAFVVRRLVLLIVVIWGVTTVTFAVTMVTGDPVTLMAGMLSSREDVEEMRHALGLDRPLPEQYVTYMWKAMHGDFGMSFRHREPALGLVLDRVPATLQLTLAALAISVTLAVPLGTLAAIKRGSGYDSLAMGLALVGQAMPSFWLGTLLMLVFGVLLRWLPVGGRVGWTSLLLPAITVSAYPLARNTRLIRSSMLEVLGKEYITTARGKGLSEMTVLIRHALRNALVPVITLVALDMGSLLGGAVIVETIFAWPGVGRLVIQAIEQRDFPVIQAGVIMVAVVIVTINLLVDLLYTVLDPRIRYS